LVAVAAAAWRVWRGYRRGGLDDLVSSLGRKQLAGTVGDPERLARLVEKLLWALPPYGAGPCLRRSLVLFDLWARCGLAPRLHLGVRAREGGVEAHAWIEVRHHATDSKVADAGGFESIVVLG
jgi:hypothetical protein